MCNIGIAIGPLINTTTAAINAANIKADNGIKYRCLQLSYMEKEDNDFKRIVDFYVTDDLNHVPVRLDMFLRFGSAKAFLIGMNGTRNPINSIVKYM